MSKQPINIINQSRQDLTPLDIYNMTRSQKIEKMSEHVGENIIVKIWIIYKSVDNVSGEEKEILSVMNENGVVFATNSSTFIDEFMYITELFGDAIPPVEVVKGTSKAGRTFITCTV